VRVPSASELLGAWERGLDRGPVERGLLLLALASPEDDPQYLASVGIGERNRRLLALREALFGSQLTGVAVCVACSQRLDLDFVADDLLGGPATTEQLMLREGEYEVELRLPDSRDLLAASLAASAEHAASLLLERCVVATRVSGGPSSEPLPRHLVTAAARRLADADPQADVQLLLRCPSCGADCTTPFDIVLFLWTEIERWAARLFVEVHVLAGAYGWAEREILSLSDARRRQYLQMVGA
jgi:hypothetical protein